MNTHAAKSFVVPGTPLGTKTDLEPVELSLDTLALVAGGEGTVTLYKKPHFVSHAATTL